MLDGAMQRMVRSIFAVLLSAAIIGPAAAETVSVKYRGPVLLDTFQCQDISRSSFIERVCFDVAQQYMVIKLKGIYYHYCEIDSGTVGDLLAANSMGTYFSKNIKGTGSDGPFDCRTHRVPAY